MHQFRQLVTRAEVTDGGGLRGYAAVYGQPTTRQNTYPGEESIARGAFNGLLDGDVVALVNHDMGQLLGRTASGTLRLSSDDHGLGFELDLPDTQLGHDIRELVKRGDLRGMSFGAVVGDVDRIAGGVVHRKFARLIDVSVVTSPAYVGTEVLARNADPGRVREQMIRARHRAAYGRNEL